MSDDWPAISGHASAMWRERSSAVGEIGPRAAWLEGVRLDEPHGLHADEVRYHPAAEAVLLRKNRRIVTVIPVDGRAKPRLKEAVQRCQAGHLVVDGGEA